MNNGKWLWRIVGMLPTVLAFGCTSDGLTMRSSPEREGFVRSLPDTPASARLLSKEDAVGMRSGFVVLQPGKDCGWHSTENYEELIICLDGAGEVASEGSPRSALAAGQYAYNPPRTRHNVFNTGSKVMRYVYVVAPANARDDDHH